MSDGLDLLYRLQNLLNEDSDSPFLDDRTSFQLLWEAAEEFVDRTGALKATQSITTVADQAEYTLNHDYLKLYLRDNERNLFLKFNDGNFDSFPIWKDYEEIVFINDTDSVPIPSHFAIIDDPTLDSQVTGTATSTAAASGGAATLTDTAADFSDVEAGNIVHNTTDTSVGIVLSKTSSTIASTALFGGTANDWTSGDAYVIQPQGRFQIILDPPPSSSGDTLTVQYIQRPAPVFSDYGVYRFPPQFTDAIVNYAAFKYKYRDREAVFGDRWFQVWERGIALAAGSMNNSMNRKEFKVRLRKRPKS